ncbi:hypothetical protein BDW59DRAFT_76149 [Aspergillus cavernicola]|uniref:Membrane anchor Opy2 N-terminal domain-containing protein n=1 Tax=Aspergillus cavernicola TaxID=176166 RepID=A0ABR4IBA5_9EURO
MPSIADDPFSPRTLYARASDCKECPSDAPTCPACPSGTTCTMTAQSCSQCASVECVKVATSTSSDSQESSSSGGTNTGAIAGGVIGGLAAIAIITFLIWWFVIRKKRNQQRASESEKASSFAPASQAQSRKSTHSIASTVLTRASNVIQIAYIPGVTNRSPPDTPLIPPVPPLPGASPDQHFFMPGDLRDSSWSDMTTERRSMANTLRSSVATTIYRNDAIVSPMPAQQATRTRAAVVSIHNGGGPQSSPQTLSPDAPAVPAITQSQLAKAGVVDANTKSSIVARTVTAKPVMVKTIGKKSNTSNTPTVQPIQEQSESGPESSSNQNPPTNSSFDVSSSSDSDPTLGPAANERTSTHAETGNSARRSRTSTVIEDSPAINQSPFNDQRPTETNRRQSSLLEGHRSNRHSGAPPPRVESPFADVNEVK